MEVVRRLTSRRSDLSKERLTAALRGIELHRKTLEGVRSRLEVRRQALFQAAIKAIERTDDTRAAVYASEHSEMRKIVRVVTVCELALAQVMLRLESIGEIAEVVHHMGAAMKTVKGVAKPVSQLASSAERIEETVNLTLSETMTALGRASPSISIDVDACSAEEIVESAKRYAKQKALELQEDLPAPVLLALGDPIAEGARRVAVLATGSEQTDPELDLSLSSRLAKRGLEQELCDYISKQGGRINIRDASIDLNMPIEDIEDSVLKLGAEGRIRLSGQA